MSSYKVHKASSTLSFHRLLPDTNYGVFFNKGSFFPFLPFVRLDRSYYEVFDKLQRYCAREMHGGRCRAKNHSKGASDDINSWKYCS